MEWFGDEYSEVFTEPSAADEIINKAVNDLADLLTETAKGAISGALNAAGKQIEADKKLSETKHKIKYAESKLSDLEQKINDALKRAEEVEIRDIPRRYLNRMVREAIGSYAPGDKVWIIRGKFEQTECSICHGEKKVKSLINGEELRITCPKCGGYGKETKTTHYVTQAEIRDVYLKLCFDKERAMYWNHENIYIYGLESSIPLKDIFATKEEAEKALENIEKEK